MCGLARTDLTTSQKVELAASALAGQAVYGRVTEAATRFEVSRPTAYRAAGQAVEVLTDHFSNPRDCVTVTVDKAQLQRALVGLRAIAPNSLRGIEELLPIVYPGVSMSYGSVHAVLAEAQAAAARHNVEADLSGIRAGALDEMYSQGAPVLAGVNLDAGYLFALALRSSRSTEDWTEVLAACRAQGLSLDVVVKDAASGIAGGVDAVFPDAEQRDDCFHALYYLGQVQQLLERSAYAAMGHEVEAEHRLHRARGRVEPMSPQQLQSLRQKLNGVRRIIGRKMALHDAFEQLSRRAAEALELVDLERGELRDPAWMQAELESVADGLMALSHKRCKSVGRYLKNRAPGLVCYAADLRQRFAQLADDLGDNGDNVVRLACTAWRLLCDARCGRRPWQRHEDYRHLLGAMALLQHNAPDHYQMVLAEVEAIWLKRHRASSAVEGFNAFLRPFLYVHKGVSQGFLELLRARYNGRIRRWGRHKGTSATQLLHGDPGSDWLTALGYPPSAANLAN